MVSSNVADESLYFEVLLGRRAGRHGVLKCWGGGEMVGWHSRVQLAGGTLSSVRDIFVVIAVVLLVVLRYDIQDTAS